MFRHADKIEYDGYWKNNKASGFGLLKSPSGAFYEGEWEDDL